MIHCPCCDRWLEAMDFAPLVTRSKVSLHRECRECEKVMGAQADRDQNKTWLLLETQRLG